MYQYAPTDVRKRAWRDRKITWEEFHSGNYTTLQDSWDEIFSRWVRAKKVCTGTETAKFLAAMGKREKLNPGGWWRGKSERITFRCGVFWCEDWGCWKTAPKTCLICGQSTGYLLCESHAKKANKSKIKGHEEYANRQLTLMVRRIEKGSYNGNLGAGNKRT